MRTIRIAKTVGTLLVGGLTFLGGVRAAGAEEARHEALGRDGTFFQLRAGAYGTAFPEGVEVSPETPILGLDVTTPAGECLHYIVPRSLGWETDAEERLFVEPLTGAVFVLFIVRGDGTDEVHLARWSGGSFTDDFHLSDAWNGSRRNLDAIFTRQILVPSAGSIGSGGFAPQVLQAIWWDVPNGGMPTARYVPVFVDRDGRVTTTGTGSFDIASFLAPPSEPCSAPIPAAAEFPGVAKDSSRFDMSHVTVWWPAACSWAVVPVQFGEVSEIRANRFLPFIGIAYPLPPPTSQPAGGSDSRVASATSGSAIAGYPAAASWTDGSVFRYQLWDNKSIPAAWLEPALIPLGGDVTLAKARRLVQDLLDSH